MSPYHAIRKLYVECPGLPMTWEQLVGWHLDYPFAHVYKSSDFFVMGRPVVKGVPAAMIRDLTVHFPISRCDAWFLYAFGGDIEKAWSVLPYELPWMCWDRWDRPTNELRWVATESFRRHTVRPPANHGA